ncbi:MAG: cobaltochelatase subunit CobT [Pseudomonadota bacterium]|nr:cobaltochelatase subunit CobT [Pseudomonadota bacterium]
MNKKQFSNEPVKKALSETTRAISKKNDLTINFENEATKINQNTIQLSRISNDNSRNDIIFARGEADSKALYIRYHDESIDHKYAPNGDIALSLFNEMEKARCEAIGGSIYPGAAKNIENKIEKESKKFFEKSEPNQKFPLQDSLRLLIKKKTLHYKLSKNSQKGLDMWEDFILNESKSNFSKILSSIDNQEEFAKLSRNIIKDLGYGDQLGEEPEYDDNADNDNQNDESNESENSDENDNDEQQLPDEVEELVSDSSTTDDLSVEEEINEVEPQEDTNEEQNNRKKTNSFFSEADPNYKVFNNIYDEEVLAENLAAEEELAKLRIYLEQQLDQLKGAVSRLANKLQRRLQAQQNRTWKFDLEEGFLDASRLARIITNPTTPLTYKQESEIEFKDTIVTLLIDNSGSMRGRPISIAAICAEIIASTLERCQVKCEILGFTTKAWKGGKSREDWLSKDRPNNPGRLNDLRHVIYKQADVPLRRARLNLGLMMKEGLLKENIDGEALEWANKRLIKRSESRKILMVISDGAPVDDSTLSVNPSNYLENHLKNVISMIEKRGLLELIAIGIGHDVTRYYRNAITITDIEQLAGAMTEQLARLFDKKEKKLKVA